MQYQFFTIPVQQANEAAEALNHFCRQHRIVHMDKQLVDATP